MKTNQLISLKKIVQVWLFLFMPFFVWGQHPLVEYNFDAPTTWNTPSVLAAGVLPEPTLKYWRPNGSNRTELTPNFDNGYLVAFQQNDYVELTINTTGFTSLNLSFDLKLKGGGFVAGGTWSVVFNRGNGWESNGEVSGTTWFLDQTDERKYNQPLPGDFSAVNPLVIRITATDWNLWGSTSLQLDNLKLTYGNPKIGIYSDSNFPIPHLSSASVAMNTDFGTVQTNNTAVTKTYRVRNYLGEVGSQLNISNITVVGPHAADFSVSPTTLSSILPTTSQTEGSSTYKTFNVSFQPRADGLRTAQVYVYSNAAPSPYVFTVVGTGASCNLVTGTYASNSMNGGSQTLLANYETSDLISGRSNNANQNSLGIRLFPNGNLYTSANHSWYTRNRTRTIEFGDLDISTQKDVAISFNVAAFSTNSGSGPNKDSYITLSVQKLDNSWSSEMQLRGSNNVDGFNYAFNTNSPRVFASTYDGDNNAKEEVNRNEAPFGLSQVRFHKMTLNLPASAGIQNLKFRITVHSPDDSRIWLIDDVMITSSNAVYKTWTRNNWTGGRPNEREKAIFTGNYNFSSSQNSDLSVCECEVLDGHTLTIPNSRTLNVRGKIINRGNGDNFIVKTGGNLIQLEEGAVNVGQITAERLVSGINNVSTQMDYLYWSSPVFGQGLQAFSTGTPANRIYQYNEPNDLFKAVSLASEPNFIPGKGYAFRAENGLPNPYSKTYLFKGVPNNGEITIGVQRSPNTGPTGQVEHGYNLIGNPYPSNLSFPQFHALNSDVIHNTAWFWTNNFFTPNQQGSGYGQNNYAVWNGTGGVAATSAADQNPGNPNGNNAVPNGTVAVGQGFIVQVKNVGAGQQLKFRNRNGNNSLRVSTATTFFSRSEEQTDRFWLKLISADGIANTQLIGYINGATNDYDRDFDAELMSMSSDAFYSVLDDKKLQIQGRAHFVKEDQVVLGANIFNDGQYTIQLENPEGIFSTGQSIYLKDNLLNTFTNLNEQNYVFQAQKGIMEGRFEIVYVPLVVLGTDHVALNQLQVYRNADVFIVKTERGNVDEVEVFDVSGRLIKKLQGKSNELQVDASDLQNGIYILKIKRNGEILSRKVLK